MHSRIAIDEAELIAAARDGDRAAFHQLYLEHVAVIHRFLRARTSREVADDLTAETFARAFAAISRFDVRGAPLRAWLFRIARNLLIGRGRTHREEVVLVEDEHGDPSPDPFDVVAGLLDADRLRGCMLELAESHRTVLELRFLGELSVAETAVALGSTEDAVRALTYRALRVLRGLYEPVVRRR